MKITSARFSVSAVDMAQCPSDGLPEIALIGRSNVGKSSLINRFLNRKGLAKTSSAPGKTRTINFYCVNDAFYLVDLPGLGYARVPLAIKRSWERMVGGYLETREAVAGALVILDARRDVGENERLLYGWLAEQGIPAGTVLTKTDKLSRNRLSARTAALKRAMPGVEPVLFSAQTGHGKDALGRLITGMLKAQRQ